jgi:hypothetical protein
LSSSDVCDKGGKSFVSNLKESLQNEGIATEVKGYPGYVGMSDKGKVLQGDEVPKNKRMMEEGGTGPVTLTLKPFFSLLMSPCI